ncbi:16S rRNA (cytosine(1402)-N(4))-methyltransferase RsmH [Gammaproteobacteria bacterium]|nr:16S rRNA (cytosine(1402)-N(4))-methyltransferase RsmH [Gammaproteobacteria bacterium]
MDNTSFHIPVLKSDSIQQLITDENGIYIDATLGYGGHTREILDKTTNNARIYGIDKDIDAIEFNQNELTNEKRFTLKHGCFSSLDEYAKSWNIFGAVNGILFDLGVSSVHLDDADRGFSFNKDAPLDMRFNRSEGKTVSDYLNKLPEKEIDRILRVYGQEKFSKRIARNIIKYREKNRITNTLELVDIINKSVLVNDKHKHNATRSFQALRIFINNELDILKNVLAKSFDILAPKGRLVLISYHSLEERVIKDFLIYTDHYLSAPRKMPIKHDFMDKMFNLIKKIKPSDEEININPRSRSAKINVLEKQS